MFFTWKDVLFEHSNIFIPVRSTVLVKEANSMTHFVNYVSYFTPQCFASNCQLLGLVSTATNSGGTASEQVSKTGMYRQYLPMYTKFPRLN